MVGFVYYVGYGLLGQVGNSVYGSNFHFFVDSTGVCVQCTAEDVREADYIINLIGIV